MLSKEDIRIHLAAEYGTYVREFSENNILGTFTVGKANYGFAENENDLRFITVYLPTFEELCTGKFVDFKTPRGELFDIRSVYLFATRNELNALEILYSDYFIITPKYKHDFKKLWFDKREKIAHYNERGRLMKAFEGAVAAASRHDAFEVVRLYQGACTYKRGEDVYKCFHQDSPMEVHNLKDALKADNEFDTFALADAIKEMAEDAPEKIDLEAATILKKGVVDLMSIALANNPTMDDLVRVLTKTEFKALKILKTKLTDGIGSVSVVKLVEETDISRPVWKNLFLKLKDNNAAEITNNGVKGTHIKLLF